MNEEKPKYEPQAPSPVRIWRDHKQFARGSKGLEFYSYSDAAADAALAFSSHATTKADSLAAQRNTLTVANLTFVTALLGFVLASETPGRELVYAAIGLLFTAGTLAWIITNQIGVAEVYYFSASSRAKEIAQRHYRLRDIHWHSDAEYEAAMGAFKGVFDQHSYRLIATLNFLIPAFSAFLLAANIETISLQQTGGTD